MIFPGIKKISKELSLYYSKNQTFGIYNDYFIRLGDGNNYKYTSIEFNEIGDSNIKLLNKLITERKKDFKFFTYKISTTSIYYEFIEIIKPFSVQKIKAVIIETIKLLVENNINGSKKCHKCNTSENIDFYHFQSNGLKLCESCFLNLNYEQQRKKEEIKHEDKKYLSGLFGFLIFGLPGIIIGVLLYIFLNRIASVSTLAVFTFGLKGYSVFGGKTGKFTIPILIFSTLIYTIIGAFLNIYFYLLKLGYEYNVIVKNIISNTKIIDAFKRDFILYIIFSLFIIVPYIFYMISAFIFPIYQKARRF